MDQFTSVLLLSQSKMNELQRILSDILVSSDNYWSSCVGESGISQNDIVAMASDMRANLMSALELTTSLHESNLQCMAQVMALKREKAKCDSNNMKQIQVMIDVLEGRVFDMFSESTGKG